MPRRSSTDKGATSSLGATSGFAEVKAGDEASRTEAKIAFSILRLPMLRDHPISVLLILARRVFAAPNHPTRDARLRGATAGLVATGDSHPELQLRRGEAGR